MRVESKSSRSTALYPTLPPGDQGWLEVGDGHRMFWETSGNRSGHPALFIHGGPGGGCNADHRRLFDPDHYRIVLFDQRGCGRSRPHGSIRANTTAHLIGDIERLRTHLGIRRWLLVGGSWGSTLALLYAQRYPEHVAGMVLRGVFTARRIELDWLYRDGASNLFPEAWADFIGPIPIHERHDLVSAYHRRVFAPNEAVCIEFARRWCAWEARVMTLLPRPGHPLDAFDDLAIMSLARLETHYFVNHAFIEEGQILADIRLLAGIPATIVQGRYDVVTPPRTAFDLHAAWPGSLLQIVPDAGHASSEPGVMRRLIEAIDAFSA